MDFRKVTPDTINYNSIKLRIILAEKQTGLGIAPANLEKLS
jgi:hypothetical protein